MIDMKIYILILSNSFNEPTHWFGVFVSLLVFSYIHYKTLEQTYKKLTTIFYHEWEIIIFPLQIKTRGS